MTQHSTFDQHWSNADHTLSRGKPIEEQAEHASSLSDGSQPAVVHPNFDPNQTPLDPARPLNHIPEPARRLSGQLRRLYGKSSRFYQPNEQLLSQWQLVASEPFAEHLALLSAAKLIAIPPSFYSPYRSSGQGQQSAQPLLSSLEEMNLLDLADIQQVLSQYPALTRYGFSVKDKDNSKDEDSSDEETAQQPQRSLRALCKRHDPDELLNSVYADDWEVMLQPEQFETGKGSLATDIMACSAAVHVLKQCPTRKTINQSYSAEQICQHVRSYLLSQVLHTPAHHYQYRQIRLFTGHVIAAAIHLGWKIQVSDDGACYFNISSRCSLLTRYANMQAYYINGWVSG